MPRNRTVHPDEPEHQPWERYPGEGDQRWEAFQIYRDQLLNGDTKRSLRRCATAVNKGTTIVARWSTDDDWRRRVEAYDREQDSIRLAESAKQIRAATRRHSRHLEASAIALFQPIEAYLKRIAKIREGRGDPFDEMTVRELGVEARAAVKLVPALVQVERLVHGLSTDRSEGVQVDPAVAEARQRIAGASRGELDAYLLGVDDATRSARDDALTDSGDPVGADS